MLHESCDNNKVEMVNFLLRQNAKVNTINEVSETRNPFIKLLMEENLKNPF